MGKHVGKRKCSSQSCLIYSNVYNIKFSNLTLWVNGNAVAVSNGAVGVATGFSTTGTTLSYHVKLNVNDKVYLTFYQSNGGSISADAKSMGKHAWFSGYLIFED